MVGQHDAILGPLDGLHALPQATVVGSDVPLCGRSSNTHVDIKLIIRILITVINIR